MKVNRFSKQYVPGSGPMVANAYGDELEFSDNKPLETASVTVEPETEAVGAAWRVFKPCRRPLVPNLRARRHANPRRRPHS
jgi:hypothetical protein